MKENTVPICPGAELAFSTGAEMSWCRTVLFPSVAAVFWYHFPRTNDYNRSLLGNYIFIVAQRSEVPLYLVIDRTSNSCDFIEVNDYTTWSKSWHILEYSGPRFNMSNIITSILYRNRKIVINLFQWLTIRILFKLKHIHSDFCFKQF